MEDPSNVERAEAAIDLDVAGEPDLVATLAVGTVVEGKYRIDGILGRGGMGFVASATHLDLNERLALKFLHLSDEQNGVDFRARFALEARVCARLRNEHIARVQDVGVWQDKTPFMVMEYLEGIDLRRMLRGGTKLAVEQAVGYIVQVCEGLAEAHAQGIIHRDLKPANIFVTKRADGTDLVKVLDFGISKWTSDEEPVGELTKTGMMLGSPKYMSPEQLNGDVIDARADVWSLGAVLYQMLTGRPPYDFPQVTQTFLAIATGARPAAPSALVPSVPAALDAVVLRCLTCDKGARIQNVAELAGALLEATASPFAEQVKAQIGASLAPTVAVSNRAAPLAMTSGSYAAFAFGNTAASPMPLASELREASSPSTGSVWSRRVVPAAIVALVASALFAVSQVHGARAEGNAARFEATSPTKSVVAKHLAHEGATALVAREARDASVAFVPSPRAASRPIARPAVRAASQVGPMTPAAPAPSATPASVSSPAPSAAPAHPAREGSALEDRQ